MQLRCGKKGKFIRILSTLILLLLFSTIAVLMVVVSEAYYLVKYTPEEQYSTDIHKCDSEDLNVTISMWHMRSIQPNNSEVMRISREIIGQQSPENLTQEQWLTNAELIFDWVIWNIAYNYSANPFPRLPNETIRSRSGDCDDLAILYMAMAINAGVPADNIRLVISGQGFTDNISPCKPTHMYVELKYVYNGKTIWMPIELTKKTGRFNLFLTELHTPGVRFYWLGYRKQGYFDDRNIEKDSSYETKIRLFKAYTNDSLSMDNLKEILGHAINRHI